jgi:hypothetical protein
MTPHPNGSAAIKQLFPGIKVTSGSRGPDHKLSQKNPGSWHASTHAAVDVSPPPGMKFSEFIGRIQAAGYPILEYRDEVSDPASHTTGPHWHVVIGDVGSASNVGLMSTPEMSAPSAQMAPPPPMLPTFKIPEKDNRQLTMFESKDRRKSKEMSVEQAKEKTKEPLKITIIENKSDKKNVMVAKMAHQLKVPSPTAVAALDAHIYFVG